jgi:hypothetical protein
MERCPRLIGGAEFRLASGHLAGNTLLRIKTDVRNSTDRREPTQQSRYGKSRRS